MLNLVGNPKDMISRGRGSTNQNTKKCLVITLKEITSIVLILLIGLNCVVSAYTRVSKNILHSVIFQIAFPVQKLNAC